MPKVESKFIVHKSRGSAKPYAKAIKEEVEKLKQVRAIKEVFFPDIVVVKKNRKWGVCIDFTNLNKAYSKDSFPILKIDKLVDATYGHLRMSFLDAFQGYH